jgi:N-methylhydantoinase A/oxoprolinase/acetone carboxylase beta subunit
VATGLLDKPSSEVGGTAMPERPQWSRQVFIDGGWREVPVYDRAGLLADGGGAVIEGPALVAEDYTVLLIAPGWRLKARSGGDLVCERGER